MGREKGGEEDEKDEGTCTCTNISGSLLVLSMSRESKKERKTERGGRQRYTKTHLSIIIIMPQYPL